MMASEVIKAVAAKHGLQPHDILGRDRFGHFIAARREVARTLRAMGHSYSWIGREMSRDPTTILNYCNDNYAARRSARRREEWKRRRAKQ